MGVPKIVPFGLKDIYFVTHDASGLTTGRYRGHPKRPSGHRPCLFGSIHTRGTLPPFYVKEASSNSSFSSGSGFSSARREDEIRRGDEVGGASLSHEPHAGTQMR